MINIAILIPSFNNEDTITYTLESIQSQGEWLKKISAVYIADDCSSDRTIASAEASWQSLIPLQVFPANKNVGERGNVNRAMTLIRDIDWVLLLHSDDIAKPNWLEMMVSRIEVCPDNVGSICSSWDNLMSDGSIEPGEDDPSRKIEVIEGNNDAIKGTLLKGCWWHISGCAIRVKAFEDCGCFDPNLPQLGDWEWLLRCLQSGWSVEYIPRTLILYRQHVGSVSSKSFQTHRDIREFLQIIPKYITFLESHDLFYIYLQRMRFIFRRLVKSLITLNTQRVWQSFQVFFMLLGSLRACQKQLKMIDE
ncbi:glycosyltransferase [Hassallia byssoidea VB512170]|uniref:Glycosyltransferase n=1 Tax=Hassallia byssoidea VB512170 TaxID=1304833 RepID=A0A846H4N8_9CYAN|nr:glycosyltransferase [Hassalia byssoidea]NEU71604.1 glycosyltransferase [Hassalia byssoidea VB512170]